MKKFIAFLGLAFCLAAIGQAPPFVRNPITTNVITGGSPGDVLTRDGTGKPVWVPPISCTNASFTSITTGTNTVATMVVGSGASLGPDGTGVINANQFKGVSSVDATEFGYIDGVTAPIQTQLDGKQPLDADLTAIAGLTPSQGDLIMRGASAWSLLSPGTAGTYLKSAGPGASLAWDTPATDFYVVTTVSGLHSITGSGSKTNAWVNGRSRVNDGGQGFCYWSATSSTATNLGTVFASPWGSATGRWIRYMYDGPVNVCWFGANGTDTTDDTTAIQAAITYAQQWSAYPNSGPAVVYIPPGNYYISSSLVVPYVGANYSLVIRGEASDTSWLYGTITDGSPILLVQNPQTTVENLAFQSSTVPPKSWRCDGLFFDTSRCEARNLRFRLLSRGLVLSSENGVYDVSGIYASGCVANIVVADDTGGVGAVTMSRIYTDGAYEVDFAAKGLTGATITGLHSQCSNSIFAANLSSVGNTTIGSSYIEKGPVAFGFPITNRVHSLTVNTGDMVTCTLVLTNQFHDLNNGVSVDIWDAFESEFNGTFTLTSGDKRTNIFTFVLPSPAAHTSASGDIKVRLSAGSTSLGMTGCTLDTSNWGDIGIFLGNINDCWFGNSPRKVLDTWGSVKNVTFATPTDRNNNITGSLVFTGPDSPSKGWFDKPVNYFPDPDFNNPTNWVTNVTASGGVTGSFVEITDSFGANRRVLRVDYPASSTTSWRMYLDPKWLRPLLGSGVEFALRVWMPDNGQLMSPHTGYPSPVLYLNGASYSLTAMFDYSWGSSVDLEKWHWLHIRSDTPLTTISSPYISFTKAGTTSDTTYMLWDSIYIGKAGIGNNIDICNYNWINYWSGHLVGGNEAYTGYAGDPTFIMGGRAYEGDTDKNGGTLYLDGGMSTGTGTSTVQIRTATAGTSGTNYNVPTAALTLDGAGNLTLNKGTQTTIRSLTYTWPTANAAGALMNDGSGMLTWTPLPYEIGAAVTGETNAVVTGTNLVTLRVPRAFTLTAVRASLSTAQTSGSLLTVDINENGSSVLSTKITFDNGEKTSYTATTPAVISDSSIAEDAEITVDVDQVGDGTAKGLKIWLIGHL